MAKQQAYRAGNLLPSSLETASTRLSLVLLPPYGLALLYEIFELGRSLGIAAAQL